jgi:hypothetical protein
VGEILAPFHSSVYGFNQLIIYKVLRERRYYIIAYLNKTGPRTVNNQFSEPSASDFHRLLSAIFIAVRFGILQCLELFTLFFIFHYKTIYTVYYYCTVSKMRV